MAKNYEIKSGDSYWDIAKQLYGGDDATINENRKKLQALNEGKALFAGDTLILDNAPEPPRANPGGADERRTPAIPADPFGLSDPSVSGVPPMLRPRPQMGQRESMTDPRSLFGQGGQPQSMTEPRSLFGGPPADPETPSPGGYKILNLPQHLLPVESPSMAPKGDPNADARMQALMMLARDRGQEAPAAQGMTGMPNMDQLGNFAQMFGAVGSQVPSMSILRQLFGGQQ
jgi:hypothetical protein